MLLEVYLFADFWFDIVFLNPSVYRDVAEPHVLIIFSFSFPMERIVDVLFVIGLIVNLLKGADLILRPHQQKWVQEKFESFTLWLTDTKPLQLYRNLSKQKVKTVIAILASTYLVSSLILMVYFFHYPQRADGDVFEDPLGVSLLIVGGLVAVTMIAYPITQWLLKSTNFAFFLLRFLSLIVLLIGLRFCTKPFLDSGNANAAVALLLYIAWLSLAVVITAGVFVIAFSVILVLSESFLVIVRGVAWRIAEYNKGAFAAIILIITIALGVAELYLKFIQPPAVSSPATPLQSDPSVPGTSPRL